MPAGSFSDPTYPTGPVALGYLGVTDEYLADLAASEFALICPKDQDGAAGEDGAFLTSDPYTLNSASTSFSGQGVQPGDIVAILDKKTNSARVRGLFVASTVATTTVTLRSRGPRVGFGAPPGLPGGETGLHFRVPTARPQITISAAKFARRYRIGDPSQILQPYDFVPVVAYDSLVELYSLAARQAQNDGQRDSLWAKAKSWAAERDEEIKILDATYKTIPDAMPLVGGTLMVRTVRPRCGPYGPANGWDDWEM